jgi:hypothetical protein
MTFEVVAFLAGDDGSFVNAKSCTSVSFAFGEPLGSAEVPWKSIIDVSTF